MGDDLLEQALAALKVADRLLSERDNIGGPDDPEALKFYEQDFLDDWRLMRSAITAIASEVGQDTGFDVASSPCF